MDCPNDIVEGGIAGQEAELDGLDTSVFLTYVRQILTLLNRTRFTNVKILMLADDQCQNLTSVFDVFDTITLEMSSNLMTNSIF